jgi:hypothetical protein
MLSEHEKACCLSLVHAHVSNGKQYTSWVPSYSTVRRPLTDYYRVGRLNRCHAVSIQIGGHYRRKALYRKLLSALKCTCKFEDVSYKDTGWP